jgi:hypothetical protein
MSVSRVLKSFRFVVAILTCRVNTVQKVDVAQRAEELLSCIQIYGCATRGTKRP